MHSRWITLDDYHVNGIATYFRKFKFDFIICKREPIFCYYVPYNTITSYICTNE